MTKQQHLPAVTTAQLSTVCESIAFNAMQANMQFERSVKMAEEIKEAQKVLANTRKSSADFYKSLNTQIKDLRKLGLDFGAMPKGKKACFERKYREDIDREVFEIPEGAGVGSILMHKFIDAGLSEGSAYNMAMLIKFCTINGTAILPKSEDGTGVNYSNYLEQAQSSGVPAIDDNKKLLAFKKVGKDKYAVTIPTAKPTETNKPTETAKPTETSKPADLVKIDTKSKGKTEKSFIDNLLLAMIDDKGIGNILVRFTARMADQPDLVTDAGEAFTIFVEVLQELGHVVKNNGKISKLIK